MKQLLRAYRPEEKHAMLEAMVAVWLSDVFNSMCFANFLQKDLLTGRIFDPLR